MCGKFTQMYSWRTLVGMMRGLSGESTEDDRVEMLTPMRFANVIHLDENGERQLSPMRWGFIAPWDPEKKIIHARCETVDTLRTFKEAFIKRRGILVTRTFNEGQEVGSKTRQYVLTPKDGKPICIAVVYQQVTDPGGASFWTFAMVTTPNNKLIGTITDRMPAVLQPQDWAKWLGEEPATTEELKAMLKPFEGDWEMGPEKPDPPRKPPKPPAPRKTDKPSQGNLFG